MLGAADEIRVRPRRGIDNRLNLSSNELLHPELPDLLRQIAASFDPAVLGAYPQQQATVGALAETFNLADFDSVVMGPGSDALIRLLQLGLWDEYFGIILQTPNYEAWTVSPRLERWRLTPVLTQPGGTLVEQLGPAMEAVPRSLVVVCWPESPSGRTVDIAEVVALRDAAACLGHLLVVDGCYSAFVAPEASEQLVQLGGPACVVLLSWSKMFGLAGSRFAVAVSDEVLCRTLRAFRVEDHIDALCHHMVRGTCARIPQFREMWKDIAETRDMMRCSLNPRFTNGIPFSGANYLQLPIGDATRAAWLTKGLSDAGYRVRNMKDLVGLEHYVRFTVAAGSAQVSFLTILLSLLDEIAAIPTNAPK